MGSVAVTVAVPSGGSTVAVGTTVPDTPALAPGPASTGVAVAVMSSVVVTTEVAVTTSVAATAGVELMGAVEPSAGSAMVTLAQRTERSRMAMASCATRSVVWRVTVSR